VNIKLNSKAALYLRTVNLASGREALKT